jgi:hypothetical protein
MDGLDQAVDLLKLAKSLLDAEGEGIAAYLADMAMTETVSAREARRNRSATAHTRKR